MKQKELVWMIGLYLILDGTISIAHFPDATVSETIFRWVRAILGVVLLRTKQ